jgi:soluble lytic murein transglycosylase-like protein
MKNHLSKTGKVILILGLLWCPFKPYPALASPTQDQLDFKELLNAARTPQAAAALDLAPYKYRDPAAMPANLAPMWPIYSFLLGEIFRIKGDTVQAQRMYQGLVEWGVANAPNHGWGGSGLVGLGLWRLLQIQAATATLPPADQERLLENGSMLLNTRLVRGMFETLPVLPALPQLQEEILRSLVSLAWSIGKKTEAQRFFVEYISIARNGDLNPVETSLFDEAVASKELSPDLVALFFGKRLQKLGDADGSSQWLNRARESHVAQVRASASFYLASLQHRMGEKCGNPEMSEMLATAIRDSSDPDIIQNALFLRAQIFMREGCKNRDIQKFKANLNQILKQFPRGRLADDALNQLASHYLELYCDSGNRQYLEKGIQLYTQLQDNFQERDDFIDSSFLRPAIALYSRGGQAEIKRAVTLLQNLEEARPIGPMHLCALFWLGRFHEDLGQTEEANRYFAQIIKETPYDYYAIRARQHLHLGKAAAKVLNMDAATETELRDAYVASKKVEISFAGDSPYHLRLQKAVESGLYYQAFKSHIDLKRQKFPAQRLEDISLGELDRFNLIPDTAIHLSLRQDALAAVDSPAEIWNRMETANALGNFKSPDWPHGDWPLVIFLTGASDKPSKIRGDTQQDPRYLAIAYPVTFKKLILKYSNAYQLPPYLIYSLIRHESAFSPTALSDAGALGLFQFIKSTFNLLEHSWRVLETKGKRDRVEFLLDPDCSIYLGARWFRKEVLPRQGGNYLWALMDHISGPNAVNAWKRKWRMVKKDTDYEYMLETVRYTSTRVFTRRVLASAWIAQAAGIFQEN